MVLASVWATPTRSVLPWHLFHVSTTSNVLAMLMWHLCENQHLPKQGNHAGKPKWREGGGTVTCRCPTGPSGARGRVRLRGRRMPRNLPDWGEKGHDLHFIQADIKKIVKHKSVRWEKLSFLCVSLYLLLLCVWECVSVHKVRVRQKDALQGVCAVGAVMYKIYSVFILSHSTLLQQYNHECTNWRLLHFCWYFSDCDFLPSDLFWEVFYLSPWQCFKTVLLTVLEWL